MAKPARLFHTQQIHYLRKSVTFADNGNVLDVGTIPAGSLILKPISGVFVNAAFNAGTGNVLDIGSSATGDLFATDLAIGSIGFVPVDEAIGGFLVAANTAVTTTVQLSGTAASAGAAEVVIAFIPDNDG